MDKGPTRHAETWWRNDMSVIVSVRHKNYGRIGKRETQVRRRIWKKRKKLRGLFNRANVRKEKIWKRYTKG